ncbi:MAG: AlpA family phage regulatory protein [Rhodocyclaceae bacterium]|nr:AlpA family phage regulatory protein [Rhodocyclaceae bacterium]
MIVLKSTQDKAMAALQSVAGTGISRHNLPILANVLMRKSGSLDRNAMEVLCSAAGITNDFPEAGGGGAAAIDDAGADSTGGDGGAPAGTGDDDDDGGDGDGDPDRRSSRKARRKAAPLPAPRVQPATTATTPPRPLLKLPEVLAELPISRSSWYSGVRSGLYPQSVKLSAKSVAWKRSDIDRLIESLAYSN